MDHAKVSDDEQVVKFTKGLNFSVKNLLGLCLWIALLASSREYVSISVRIIAFVNFAISSFSQFFLDFNGMGLKIKINKLHVDLLYNTSVKYRGVKIITLLFLLGAMPDPMALCQI